VILSKSGLEVNGKLLGNTAPRSQDSKARPLSHYPFGTTLVQISFHGAVNLT